MTNVARKRLIRVLCSECGEQIGSAIMEFNERMAGLEDAWQVKSVERWNALKISFICDKCIARKAEEYKFGSAGRGE